MYVEHGQRGSGDLKSHIQKFLLHIFSEILINNEKDHQSYWKLEVYTQAATQRCSVKKVFLQISQDSQGSNCVGVSFLIKLQVSGLTPPVAASV